MAGIRPHETACTIWLTGLSGSGKSTLGHALADHLRDLRLPYELIDGDEIRQELCRDLGYDQAAREENVRRIGYVARLLNRHKIISIVAAISPYRASRAEVRCKIPNFLEVHVDCPLHTLIRRDVKGLYKRALAGEIPDFSGISAPYEEPLRPEVYVNSGVQAEFDCLARIISKLEILRWIPAQSTARVEHSFDHEPASAA